MKEENRKAVSLEHQEKIIKFCDKRGIKVSAFYVIGFPNETLGDIKETIKHAKKLNTFVAQFQVHTPYPGTEDYGKIEDRIYERNWEKFDAYTPTYSCKNLTRKQLLMIKEHAYVSYYFRPQWILKHWRRRFL